MYILISVIFLIVSLEFLRVSIRINLNKLPTKMFYFNIINKTLSDDTLRLIKKYCLINFFINLITIYFVLTNPLFVILTVFIHIVVTAKIQHLSNI